MKQKGTIYRRKFNFEEEVVLTRKFHSATQNWINHSMIQMKICCDSWSIIRHVMEINFVMSLVEGRKMNIWEFIENIFHLHHFIIFHFQGSKWICVMTKKNCILIQIEFFFASFFRCSFVDWKLIFMHRWIFSAGA